MQTLILTGENHLKENNIGLDEVLYMGDDIPDIPCLKAVGIATCPNDATVEVRACVDYISHIDGGKGCVRDVLEIRFFVLEKKLIFIKL